MNVSFVCFACGKKKPESPRAAGRQSYCGQNACQRARKAAWRRQRIADDHDHRANQRRCYQAWCRGHPRYWSEYRRAHPEQAERNRLLQRQRNHRRRRREPGSGALDPVIAKMDASIFFKALELPANGEYWLVPVIAKMDALKVKITTITEDCA